MFSAHRGAVCVRAFRLISLILLTCHNPTLSFGQNYLQPFDVPITSRVISSFLPDEPGRIRFGKLEYFGGVEIYSDNDHFGGFSGFRFLKNQTQFLAISDSGFWLSGSVDRKSVV